MSQAACSPEDVSSAALTSGLGTTASLGEIVARRVAGTNAAPSFMVPFGTVVTSDVGDPNGTGPQPRRERRRP
jgi:hypothetical protein